MKSFFVAGTPISKGSAKSFFSKKSGSIVTMQDNRDRQRPWSSLISYTAQQVGCQPLNGPVSLTLKFYMPRPKNHYGTGRNARTLKLSAPKYHTSTPDLDKLIRCVKDALTGVAWKDDKQVCVMPRTEKIYGDTPGVYIEIKEA